MLVSKRAKRQSDGMVTVAIHPEIHKVISHQSIDSGESIRERLHAVLCEGLKRKDLLQLKVSRQSAAS